MASRKYQQERAKLYPAAVATNRPRSAGRNVPDPVMEPFLPISFRNIGQREVCVYLMGECQIIVGRMPVSGDCHMSISCRDRYPSWDEVAHARYSIIPDEVVMAMILPSQKDYVNVHEFVFHLHQIEETPDNRERALLEQP